MEGLFSSQSIMIMLLGVYGVAMWWFLSSAPKVHTVMVSDLEQAQAFYEGVLELRRAVVPLHYYYGYEAPLGMMPEGYTPPPYSPKKDGIWYQLRKNLQLHIVTGAKRISPHRDRHLCFNRDCIEQILLRIQMKGIKHKIISEQPLRFLVKDAEGQIIEVMEATTKT
ncbi:MAG: glyoxalase-like domain protein [Pseudanabaenaceae cyanobacterium]